MSTFRSLDTLQSAIDSADIYHDGVGTTFLHIQNPLIGNRTEDTSNPTGAVVPVISMATTFRQSTPGEATAKNDPNSFGLGFEYSRTGTVLYVNVLQRTPYHYSDRRLR